MPKHRPITWSLLALSACLACAPRPEARPEVQAVPLGRPDDTDPLPDRVGRLQLLAAHELRSPDGDFGGISGAALDGDRLLLLSDRSRLFELAWPAQRQPGAPFSMPLVAERGLDGSTHGHRPFDAEALVLEADGSFLVVDEGSGRLLPFADGGTNLSGRQRQLPAPFAEPRPGNDGVEALTRLPDGSLLAISEGAWLGEDLHAAARLGEGDPPVGLRYRAGAGFSPTDAGAAGDHLFVLERRVSLFGGWQARVVALPVAELPDRAGAVFAGEELAVISGPLLGENYEAIAVHSATDGGYRLVIVSDDNFNALQRTLLLELSWTP